MRFIILLFLIFAGCSVKKPISVLPSIITIKSKSLKFSDIGYIKKYEDMVSLEIYSAGVAVLRLKIGNNVCTDEGCISKKSFNERFLNKNYPKELLKNVILGKPIFNSKNLIKKDDGFEQHIFKVDCYDIIYIVKRDKIYFKDRLNKILIKIRGVNE